MEYTSTRRPPASRISPPRLSAIYRTTIIHSLVTPARGTNPPLFPLPDWLSDDNETATLKIMGRKSTSALGAQVVWCEVEVSIATRLMKRRKIPKVVVAKIFDPAYYLDSPDNVAAADREYAQEAAAYITLHSHTLDSSPSAVKKPGLAPKFYGTWTTDVTADHLIKPWLSTTKRKKTIAQEAKDRAAFDKSSQSPYESTKLWPQKFRPVRLILLEHIKGYPL